MTILISVAFFRCRFLEDVASDSKMFHRIRFIEGLTILGQSFGGELIIFPYSGKYCKMNCSSFTQFSNTFKTFSHCGPDYDVQMNVAIWVWVHELVITYNESFSSLKTNAISGLWVLLMSSPKHVRFLFWKIDEFIFFFVYRKNCSKNWLRYIAIVVLHVFCCTFGGFIIHSDSMVGTAYRNCIKRIHLCSLVCHHRGLRESN